MTNAIDDTVAFSKSKHHYGSAHVLLPSATWNLLGNRTQTNNCNCSRSIFAMVMMMVMIIIMLILMLIIMVMIDNR